MAKACSRDLRERVVRCAEACGSRRAAAVRFRVSASSAIKWTQDWRREGRLEARSQMGRVRSPLAAHQEFLLSCLERQPDATLADIQRQLAGIGVKAGLSSICRFYRRHGISFKKKPARQRAGPAGRRKAAHPLEEASGSH